MFLLHSSFLLVLYSSKKQEQRDVRFSVNLHEILVLANSRAGKFKIAQIRKNKMINMQSAPERNLNQKVKA